MKMSKKRRIKSQRRSARSGTSKVSFLLKDPEAYDRLVSANYTPLDKVPQIVTAYRRIAELIGSMTIHLMENTENGDIRIRNELSRKIDIDPCSFMGRSNWMEYIVMSMLLYGHGNSVVMVKTASGMLDEMDPIPPDRVSFNVDPSGIAYQIMIDGIPVDRDMVMHFVYNPDKASPCIGMGVTSTIKSIAKCLTEAQKTEQEFMSSRWKPSLIIKANGLIDEFSDPKGRRKLLDEYVSTDNAGEPWIIPADTIEVQEVKPLSLSDIALNDSITLNAKQVSAITGVPQFVLGVGTYNQKEWNNFVQTKIRPIALIIQQEMTRQLIYSPKWYLRFNSNSLLDYDINTLASVYTMLQDRGDVSGNEVRERIGMSPAAGLDEYKVLENYIPVDMSGMQKKLNLSGGTDE